MRKYVLLCRMYFKVTSRHNPAKGKMDCYYRLMESYRNCDERVSHRTLLNVGFLNDIVTVEQLNPIRPKPSEREKQIGTDRSSEK